jgi:hypothetical protein
MHRPGTKCSGRRRITSAIAQVQDGSFRISENEIYRVCFAPIPAIDFARHKKNLSTGAIAFCLELI